MENAQQIEIIYPAKIIFSKRKTLAITISQAGEITLRAPMRTPKKHIRDFIIKAQPWLTKNIILIKNRQEKNKPKKFSNGELFLFLGKFYEFKIIDASEIHLTEFLNFPICFLQNAKEHLLNWYGEKLLEIIEERIKHYNKITGLRHSTIKISSAKKRWGSCSNKNVLNFSWRLAMAPLEIIDYVIVHEMIHISEKNHSRKFWDKVKKIMPDYKLKQKWLRLHGANLYS